MIITRRRATGAEPSECEGGVPNHGLAATFLTRAQLSRDIRARVGSQLSDDSGVPAHGVAIYALSDPRDVRQIRYIGQTRAPRQRYLQHLSTARLWLPDELPWWVKSPKLRPLYTWIRSLYADERRLPVMLVSAWVHPTQARLAERTRIYECLEHQLPLLNAETQSLGQQIVLI